MAGHVELRITVGVVLCWVLSELEFPGQVDDRSLEWCAFTIIVVAGPTLGSVVVKGSDRLVGTVVGGLVSVAICSATRNYYWLVLATSVVAVIGTFGAAYLNKDYSMKLFIMTFIMICIGVQSPGLNGIIDFAVSRTMGIALGNIMVTVLTILMWPEASSTNCIKTLRSSVETLQQLQIAVWENGAMSTGWRQLTANESFRLKVDERYVDRFLEPVAERGGGGEGLQAPARVSKSGRAMASLERLITVKGGQFSNMGQLPLNTAQDMDEMEDAFEARIDSISSALSASEKLAKESRAEIYVGNLKGWPVFLPGLDMVQIGWALPTHEITALNNTVRKLIRLYWSLQRTFQLGFDESLMTVVARSYPPCMLSTIQDGVIAVIQSVLDAFPKPGQLKPACEKVRLQALVTLCTEVKDFLEIGAEQRRQVSALLHRMDTVRDHAPRRGDLDALRPWQNLAAAPADAGPSSISEGPGQPQTPEASFPSSASLSTEGSASSESFTARRRRSIGFALCATLALPRNKNDQHLIRPMSADALREFKGLPASHPDHGRRRLSTGSSDLPRDHHQPPPQAELLDMSFPDTANGRIAKVRWYSFLFLLERVAIALVDLVEDADDLLCKLPGCSNARVA